MLQAAERLIPSLYSVFEESPRTGAPSCARCSSSSRTTRRRRRGDEFCSGCAAGRPITRPALETATSTCSRAGRGGSAHATAPALRRPRSTSSPTPRWASRRSPPRPRTRSRWAASPCTRASRSSNELTVRVFTAPRTRPSVTRHLYEDAGDGYGEASRRSLTCDGDRLRIGPRVGDVRARHTAWSRSVIEVEREVYEGERAVGRPRPLVHGRSQ